MRVFAECSWLNNEEVVEDGHVQRHSPGRITHVTLIMEAVVVAVATMEIAIKVNEAAPVASQIMTAHLTRMEVRTMDTLIPNTPVRPNSSTRRTDTNCKGCDSVDRAALPLSSQGKSVLLSA
jgi:hypothetical protein